MFPKSDPYSLPRFAPNRSTDSEASDISSFGGDGYYCRVSTQQSCNRPNSFFTLDIPDASPNDLQTPTNPPTNGSPLIPAVIPRPPEPEAGPKTPTPQNTGGVFPVPEITVRSPTPQDETEFEKLQENDTAEPQDVVPETTEKEESQPISKPQEAYVANSRTSSQETDESSEPSPSNIMSPFGDAPQTAFFRRLDSAGLGQLQFEDSTSMASITMLSRPTSLGKLLTHCLNIRKAKARVSH